MKKILITVTVFLLLSLPLSACAGAEQIPEGALVVVTPSPRPISASLKVGDTLEVRLPTIPQEGFSWQVQALDSKILKQDGEAVYVEDDGVNAAGGTTTLRFKAVGAGSTELILIFASSPDASPAMSAQSFSVSVEVVKGN
ncbi:MAG TPA: protease inhibitor I42 family protein [Anaerolineaceae bacterium]|nr:protease inhibitor I42 family protein [Anaerolineaceae bacterium]HQK03859.1 protease inhibitor I42 family protein [Anaerolineaceae bacterium]